MKSSRVLEDIGFLAAVGLGVFAGVREALSTEARPFPWVLLIVMAVLAAPKTLGRMTAGKVWDSVVSILPGKKP